MIYATRSSWIGWVVMMLATAMPVLSQDSEYTEPIGVIAYRIDGGTVEAPVTTMISLPLTDKPAASGASSFVVTSIDGQTITSTGAGWVESALAMEAFPYDVRFVTGDAAGARFAIAANTTDTLSVTGRSLSEFSILTGVTGDEAELVPVDTLEMLFGGALFMSGATAEEADEVSVFFGAGSTGSYFIDQGTSMWVQSASPTTPAGDIRLSPGGALAVARKGAPLSLVVAGGIPLSQVNIQVQNSGETFTNTGLPTDITLGGLTLETRVSGWVSSGDPSVADLVGIPAGAGWVFYFHNGSNWQRVSGPTTNRDSVEVEAGKPIRILRRGQATGTTELVVPLP